MPEVRDLAAQRRTGDGDEVGDLRFAHCSRVEVQATLVHAADHGRARRAEPCRKTLEVAVRRRHRDGDAGYLGHRQCAGAGARDALGDGRGAVRRRGCRFLICLSTCQVLK